jgi:hypothetical protein
MKKVPLVFIALAAAAGAAYCFDLRHGGRRRRETIDAVLGWRDAAQRHATDHAGDLRARVPSLADGLRLLLDRWSKPRASGDELADQAALEPLSFAPRSLEADAVSPNGVLAALAVAAPVAIAVGAAVIRRRHDGQWLH